MIEIVPPQLYSAFKSELLEMHRMRYEIFKERLDWEVPARNGMERDEFDDLSPTYFLAFDDDDDSLIGLWRLLPTTGPTMIGTTFAQLLDGHPLPSRPDFWEVSRLAIKVDSVELRSLRTLHSLNRTTFEMFCALIEFCLAEGIREVASVHDVVIARLLRRAGLIPYWQGNYHRIGKSRAVAGYFHATPELLDDVKHRGGIMSSVVQSSQWHLTAPSRTATTPLHV